MPSQEELRAIKSQQTSASKEKEKMIQGMQSQRDDGTAATQASVVYSVLNGFGEHDIHLTAADLETSSAGAGTGAGRNGHRAAECAAGFACQR